MDRKEPEFNLFGAPGVNQVLPVAVAVADLPVSRSGSVRGGNGHGGAYPFEVGALIRWLSNPGNKPTQDSCAAAGFLIWLYSQREVDRYRGRSTSCKTRTCSSPVMSWADSFHILFMVQPDVSLETRARFAAWFLCPWYPQAPE